MKKLFVLMVLLLVGCESSYVPTTIFHAGEKICGPNEGLLAVRAETLRTDTYRITCKNNLTKLISLKTASELK